MSSDFRAISDEEARSLLEDDDFPAGNFEALEISLEPDSRSRFVIKPSNFSPIKDFVDQDPDPMIFRSAKGLIHESSGIKKENVPRMPSNEVSRVLTLLSDREDVGDENGPKYSFNIDDFEPLIDYARLFYFDTCVDALENPSIDGMDDIAEDYREMSQDLKDSYWNDVRKESDFYLGQEEFSDGVVHRKKAGTDEEKLNNYFYEANLISQEGMKKASEKDINIARMAIEYFSENNS